VALVTVGTRGIGAAICRSLADEGADVAAGYWHGDEAVEKFLADMAADYPGRRITVHEGNIGRSDDCRRVVHEVIDRHGRVDILVNNAGITIDRTVAKMRRPGHVRKRIHGETAPRADTTPRQEPPRRVSFQ
jgi:NAD(P)-dependent dehydrogenase (short-subunit alcohol dehydrogenase family)